jgi:hypothetical protein
MDGSVKASGVKVGMVGRGVGEGKVGKGVVVGNDIVGRGKDIAVAVAVGMARCVSAKAVLTVAMAVCIISASLIEGAAGELSQDASITAARTKATSVLAKMFIVHFP